MLMIIDYGAGNLHSIAKACCNVTEDEVVISNNPNDLLRADRAILPGVGSFGDCIDGLKSIEGMVENISVFCNEMKRPFLGICVGMQLLAQKGFENGSHNGLGYFDATVQKISADGQKVPHMGWNNISHNNHGLFDGISQDEHMYFVHSYHMNIDNSVIATTEYGGKITAAIAKDNIMGVQFHPEKSQKAGLKLLKNFINLP